MLGLPEDAGFWVQQVVGVCFLGDGFKLALRSGGVQGDGGGGGLEESLDARHGKVQ